MTLLKKCVKNSFYQCSCLLKAIASLPPSAWGSALHTGGDSAAHHVHVHCICTGGSVHTPYTQYQVSRLLHPLSLPTHTHPQADGDWWPDAHPHAHRLHSGLEAGDGDHMGWAEGSSWPRSGPRGGSDTRDSHGHHREQGTTPDVKASVCVYM